MLIDVASRILIKKQVLLKIKIKKGNFFIFLYIAYI